MSKEHGLSVSKPVSVWNKPFKLDFRDFFKSLGKAAVNGLTLNWADAAKESVDALSAIGLEKDCGQMAWLLIARSMIQAIYDLVEENIELLKTSPDGFWNLREQSEFSMDDLAALADKLDMSLEKKELVIDEDFFKRPKELTIVEDIKTPFAQWLRGFGLNEAQATSITDRLPSYFVFALNDEWRTRREDYVCLKEALDTPFTKASEREQLWLRYSAWLQKQVDERMFFEAFSLRQVYITLRAYYEEKDKAGKGAELEHRLIGDEKRKQRVVDLEEELEAWLNKTDARDAVRVISGGPGCGKSSFTKMFAARQAAKNDRRVLLVPLHLFEPTDDLIDAMRNFVRFDKFLPPNPLDPEEGESRLLVIFDGLDELSMQGKAASEIAQQFVREVQKKADLFNYREARLKILISGRELVVQSNASEFRKPEQILHVLPYYLTDATRKGYDDSRNLLEQDQRQLWWASYGKASGNGYTEMPEVLNREELIDITSQPLLNYLVALSFTRGKVDFAKEGNLNVIYQDLLDSVYKRVWAEHPHPSLRDVQEDQFFRVLEEIAIAAWHGDGRTTTVREIEAHCDQSGLKTLLEKFQEGASQGVTQLLMAFYFRQSGRRVTGDQTFEFTHKSFGEYLTARRILRGLQRIQDELDRRQKYIDSGWDERDALTHWAKLCGPTVMDNYIFKFICNEILLQEKPDVSKWQDTLCQLIGFLLRNGMPMERVEPRPVFHEENRQARNAEESLLAVLNACARSTERISNIVWPSAIAFGEWISRLHGQREGGENILSLECLGFLNAEQCILFMKDFYEASFPHANLTNSGLAFAHFWRADLREANFREANLSGADLSEADLSGANLSEADLNRADLNRADLSGADLSGADLSGANLSGADLNGADLNGADLREANLSEAFWINGKVCKEGSIGECVQESDEPVAEDSKDV